MTTCRCKALVFDRHIGSPIKIQALWRGYKSRKHLNTFKRLPDEIWNIVLYYTKLEHNIKHKYFKSLRNIYFNRISVLDDAISNNYETNYIHDYPYYIVLNRMLINRRKEVLFQMPRY